MECKIAGIKKGKGGKGGVTSPKAHIHSPPPAETFTGELGNAGPMPSSFPTEDPGGQEGPSENEPWPPRPRDVTSLLPSLCRHCYPCITLLPGVNFLNGEQ